MIKIVGARRKNHDIYGSLSLEGENKMLKEIRESRGMSQQDLADKSGINKRMIQAYEQGYRDINGAKLTTLVTLCFVLECHLYEVVEDSQLVKDLKRYESL